MVSRLLTLIHSTHSESLYSLYRHGLDVLNGIQPIMNSGKSPIGLISAQDIATGGQFRDVWEDHIKDAMGPNYSMVKSAHMGQIR